MLLIIACIATVIRFYSRIYEYKTYFFTMNLPDIDFIFFVYTHVEIITYMMKFRPKL